MSRYLWCALLAVVFVLSASCANDAAPPKNLDGPDAGATGESASALTGFERVTGLQAVATGSVSFTESAARAQRDDDAIGEIERGPRDNPRWRDAMRRMTRAPAGSAPKVESPARAPDVPALPLASNFNALKEAGPHTTPPDTNGAAGPNHLMVALNSQIQIQTKAGANVGAPTTMNAFFATVLGANNFTSDPHVIYDPVGQRWIFVAISATANPITGAITNGSVLLAVSRTTDPTGIWNLFRIAVDGTNVNILGDYPIVGFNKNWISVSTNDFDMSTGGFVAARVFVFDKAAAYANTGSGKHTTFSAAPIQAGADFAIAGAVTLDVAANNLYLLEDFDGTTGNLRLFQVSGNVGAEVLTRLPDVNVGAALSIWADIPFDAAGTGNFIPQQGAPDEIEANDARFTQVVVRNGQIWAANNAYLPCLAPDGLGGCGPSGPTHSTVQWFVINPATSGVVNAGRVEDPAASQTQGTHYFFPAIVPNKFGDALLGFSTGGTGKFASTGYTMRFSYDPPNTMRDPSVYKPGLAPYDIIPDFSGNNRNRWGDYSKTTVDPTDDATMWSIQEYAETPGATSLFGTWWAKLTVDCAGKADGTECDDATALPNICTVKRCQAGACTQQPRTCVAQDACHVAGTCDNTTGCSNPPKVCTTTNPCLTASCSLGAGGCIDTINPDGSVCAPTPQNKCFGSFTCQQAVCTGQNPVACTTPPDACHQATGTCDAASGACSYPFVTNGTACTPAQPNACFGSFSCQFGTCSGQAPVTCVTPPDTCHQALGTCDSANGTCSYPLIADGTLCTPATSDRCFGTFTCQTGACTGQQPVACTTPPDACHQGTGTCAPATGACSYPNATDGTTCTPAQPNKCFQAFACTAGACAGKTSVTCTALDDCHDVGTCNPASGCSNPAKADGTPCSTGRCQAGTCTGGATDGGSDSGGADTGTPFDASPANDAALADGAADGGGGGTGDTGGCSCRTVGASRTSPTEMVGLGAIGLVAAVRLRRRRRVAT